MPERTKRIWAGVAAAVLLYVAFLIFGAIDYFTHAGNGEPALTDHEETLMWSIGGPAGGAMALAGILVAAYAYRPVPWLLRAGGGAFALSLVLLGAYLVTTRA